MIITCPSCATRYTIDPSALGTAGRTVRCAKCGHTWREVPPAEAPGRFGFGARTSTTPDVEPIPSHIRPNPPESEHAARPKAGLKVAAALWVLFIVALGGGLAAVYLERQAIVEAWPPAGRLYDRLGIPIETVADWLAFEGGNWAEVDQRPDRVEVKGRIRNASDEERAVPGLRVAMLDPGDQELESWRVEAVPKTLLPGEVATFGATLDRQTAGRGVKMTVSFDLVPPAGVAGLAHDAAESGGEVTTAGEPPAEPPPSH